VVNLLDTPGHQDFSEDTYRVLTAVDAALMVIDAANGVEAQTRRLIEVCRARNTPILTFINKLDREGRAPLDLIDEIETALGMTCAPLSWPVGQGKQFGGIVDLRTHAMRVFAPGQDRLPQSDNTLSLTDADTLAARFGEEWATAEAELELVTDAMPAFDRAEFLAGRQSPVFFGSAINNFGVREVLDAIVELAPPPAPRQAVERLVRPEEEKFTGVVFKIQANMDPAHRDRIAFLHVCSGRFEPGKKLKVRRTGKDLRPTNVVTFLSQRRDKVEEAYAGDIIGITTHGGLQLGDTLSEGEALQFTGLPFFAPELFRTVELADPMKSKQLAKGLKELGEEGAIQVFRPTAGSLMLLGAIGQLQFEVVAHRLKTEYGVETRLGAANYTGARWVSCPDPAELSRFIATNPTRMFTDAADAPAYLMTSRFDLNLTAERWPKIEFHAMREHAGLILQGE
jgi:peptide chain release factor 3